MDMQLPACMRMCMCACMRHLCPCMHARSICTHLLVYVCLHGMLISCLLVVCIYKMFHHTETYSLFYSSKTRSQKMLKTTEQKGLKISTVIDHSLTFNSKVSRPNIVDNYLFTKETVKSGLKRKKEPENIVGTEKSKKRLRRL